MRALPYPPRRGDSRIARHPSSVIASRCAHRRGNPFPKSSPGRGWHSASRDGCGVVGNGFRPSVKALSWERAARRAGWGKFPTAPSSSPVIAGQCGHRPLHPFTIDPVGNGFRPSVNALSWERVARRAGWGKFPTAPSSSPVIASRCAHWRGNPFPKPHSVTLHKFPPRISMRLIFA